MFQVDSGVTAILSGLTISVGSTTGNGGGLDNAGAATLNDCTISGNSAKNGGGLFTGSGGVTTLTNTTISGNSASQSGGGLFTGSGGATTLTDCTVSGNSATKGGGLYNASGTVAVGNTIVAANTAATSGPDAFGTFASQGHNLIGGTDGSSGWVGSDLTGTIAEPLDPLLAPLGNYGGPTQTMALLSGSQAIGKGVTADFPGTTTPITTDQRGGPRGSVIDIGAFQTSLVVESTSGSVDTTAANLTLPGAVLLANQFHGSTITFDPAVFATAQTITLTAPLELSDTALTTSITGPAAGVTVSGGGTSRVFQVDGGVTAALSGLTISGGWTTGDGGGLDNQGMATLTACTISGNSAKSGGGVYTGSGGTTTLTNTTVSGNSAAQNGGGLFTGSGGATTLTNCTVSGNTATNGGGLFTGSGGTTTIINCTISGNSASQNGGGLYNASGTVTIGNTIVAANTAATAGPDAFGSFASQGHNLIGETDGSSGWVGSDLTGTTAQPLDPLLAPLAYYGGPTQTMALLPGSPAIGAGAESGITTDQRGFPLDTPIDIGAFQVQSGALVVNTTADGGGCPLGKLDLRGAVDLADVLPGAHTITFDPTVFASAQTIALTSGQLELSNTSGAQTITGPAAGATVSGGGVSRVFQVDSGVTAALSGLTISGGYTTGNGGGLYNDGATITLTDVTLAGNSAAAGGALFLTKRGTTTIINCGIIANSASAGGGGLYDDEDTTMLNGLTLSGNSAAAGGALFLTKRGTTTIINCGMTGNVAAAGGGGLYSDGGTATLDGVTIAGNSAAAGGALFLTKRGTITIINCTVTGNSAAAGGGLYNDSSTAILNACTIAANSASVGGGIDNVAVGNATLEDTIVAANTGTGGSPSDIGGDSAAGVAGTYDLVGTGGSGGIAGGTGDIVLTDLNSLGLAPLGSYGGPTQTIPLLPGSAAIDTGTAIPGVSTDQRGLPPSSATPDIGAFQSQGFTLTVVAGSTPQATATGTAFTNPLAVTVTAIDPIEPVAGGIVTFSVNPAQNGASAILSAATAIIGPDGIAQVTATANSIAGGPYTAIASALGSAPTVDFQLKNLIVLNFSGIGSQSIPGGTATATFAGTLANGVQTPQGEYVAVTLNGVTQQAAIGASGAFSTTFDTAGLAISTTPYTVSYVYTSDGTFASASATSSLTVNFGGEAIPTIAWANPADITYGTALSAVQLDATASVPGTFTYNPAVGAILDAGTNQTLWVTFTPTDTTHYDTATDSVTINVDKATPDINWAGPADITYGTALSAAQLDAAAAWTVGGVNGLVAGSFTYTPAAGTVLDAGMGQIISVAFTPTDTTDYNSASGSVTINVNKATPNIAWADPADITYGTALSAIQLDAAAAWTVGGVNGTVAGTFAYTPAAGTVLNPGTGQTLSVSFTPIDTTDYNTASDSVAINVDKATPTIAWADPADIIYGTALSAAQLDAAATWKVGGVEGTVAGSFTYTPAAGSVLDAGSGQTLSVTFLPTDTTDYNTASDSATINVNKATPTIAWANPADITYGTALSARSSMRRPPGRWPASMELSRDRSPTPRPRAPCCRPAQDKTSRSRSRPRTRPITTPPPPP